MKLKALLTMIDPRQRVCILEMAPAATEAEELLHGAAADEETAELLLSPSAKIMKEFHRDSAAGLIRLYTQQKRNPDIQLIKAQGSEIIIHVDYKFSL